MSQRYLGGVISKTPVVPSGPYQDSTASGVWTLAQQADYAAQGLWPTAGNTVPFNLYGWGRNNSGQLGLGNRTDYSSPKQVGLLTNWLNIASNSDVGMAIKADGTLWTWGSNNSFGQLGLGNTTAYSSPKQVGALTNWSKISSPNLSSFAVKTDGTLWSWGANTDGQLGLGNRTNYSSPKQIGALTGWLEISSGSYFSLAVKTDGTLWSWGTNDSGQLGLGNTTKYSSPKQVGALTNWLKVSAGQYRFSAAVKTDGTLWAWGRNLLGQLGLGNTTNYSSPKQVGALTTWLAIAGGEYFCMAIRTDGTLWSWGRNNSGQLGLGNRTNYSSPVQVGALTTWSKISSGTEHVMAIKTDKTLWSWGAGAFGRLGLGNTTYYSSPKQVGSLANWYLANASNSHSLAIEN
jgi:alpha-tubulin suppressor-like RCC1 family protein